MRHPSLYRTLTLLSLVLVCFGSLSSPALASDDRCSDTGITSPVSGASLHGTVPIQGRADLPGAFVRYQVDFSTTGLNLWVLVNAAPQAIDNGILARWDTTAIPPGTYDLRVRSVDTSGNYCEAFVSAVRISTAAEAAHAPVPPTVQPTSPPPLLMPAFTTLQINGLYGPIAVPIPHIPVFSSCTPASAVGSVVTRSLRLCAGQTYRPFTVVGHDLAVVGDPSRSATIRSSGRAYAITVRGSNNLVAGVRVSGSTATGDLGNWLCVYEQCNYASPPILGGIAYGGGILLVGNGNTVLDSDVSGGVIGISVQEGRSNRLLLNRISNLTGWGILALNPVNSIFVGNVLENINRACTDPGGQSYAGGCESAGLLLLGADTNLIANNSCAASGNCYYLNGEGGRLNNFNRLYGNTCREPSFNCFEITDAQGIEFDGNQAELAPDNASGCELWLVRAHILAGGSNHVPPCNHHGSKLDSTYERIQ